MVAISLPLAQNVWYNLLAFILTDGFEASREQWIREEVHYEMARSHYR